MADPNLGQVVATVYEQTYKNEPDDNIFLSRATLFALGEKGFKKQLNGGRLIECDLEYAENTSHQMIGEMDPLDTTRYDVFDAARYDWKVAAGTCSYSYLEDSRAQGDAQKFALVERKIENSRNSHFALLNRQFWNTSTPGTNEITSIPTFIQITPTNTVGQINSNVQTWWRNKSTTATKSSTAFDNLAGAMRTIHGQTALGGDIMPPTCWISTLTIVSGYEGTQAGLIRYMFDDNMKKGADAGFLNRAINFKGAPVFFDEDVADDMYALNNKILKFVYLEWARLDPAVKPSDQLVNVHKLYTFGNFACGARRHLGRISSIT